MSIASLKNLLLKKGSEISFSDILYCRNRVIKRLNIFAIKLHDGLKLRVILLQI